MCGACQLNPGRRFETDSLVAGSIFLEVDSVVAVFHRVASSFYLKSTSELAKVKVFLELVRQVGKFRCWLGVCLGVPC